MITNECEYRETRRRVEEFRAGLEALEAARPGLDADEYAGKLSAQRRLLGDLEHQVTDYESLHSGQTKEIRCRSFGELGQALIRARIARGWSVEELAKLLDWEAGVLQELEAGEYEGATFAQMRNAAGVLCLSLNGVLKLERMRSVPTSAELLAEVKEMLGTTT